MRNDRQAKDQSGDQGRKADGGREPGGGGVTDDELVLPKDVGPETAGLRRGMSEIQKLQAYLDGDADEATTSEIKAKLNDPNSLLNRGLENMIGKPSEVAETGDWQEYLFPTRPQKS